MSRRYDPDPAALLAALARRADATDTRLDDLGTDVAALGRGLATVTESIHRLSALPAPAPGAGPAGEEEPQTDWFAVDDPALAGQILADLQHFAQTVLRRHGLVLTPTCWPLHPPVVVDLLALAAERAAAYSGARPTPVSEWLTRWLPAAAKRIETELKSCQHARGHAHEGRHYALDAFDPLSADGWWALERDRSPVHVFDLPPLPR